MNKSGLIIGIFGGIGLGLLLGNEFSGRIITILGAVILIISLCSMIIFSYKTKKKKPESDRFLSIPFSVHTKKNQIFTAISIMILLFTAMINWNVFSWLILAAIILIVIAWYIKK